MSLRRDLVAAAAALGLVFYSVSAGGSGHVLLQVVLLLAGGVLVWEQLLELSDE